MKITTKIAWRNIWRNPRRTWVLMTSISIGIIGYLGMAAFSRGFLNQMVESTINLSGGHLTVSAKGYTENPQIRLRITEPEEVETILNDYEGLRYAPAILLQGMINSAETAAGVSITGIDPDKEKEITVISQTIVEGSYLASSDSKSEIVIGVALAEKLNVRLGEKIVLMISDINNEISSEALRVVGLYRAPNPEFEKRFVYVGKGTAQKLAGYSDEVSSVSIRLAEGLRLEDEVAQLRQELNGEKYEVLSWKDRNPLLLLSLEMFDASMVVTAAIMFIAVAFTIANSFLMVIYERIQELGIMMANGVLPKRIRRMLYIEAFFITALGTVLGFSITLIFIGYWGSTGLDLSNFAEGLGMMGVGSIVYPEIWAFDVSVGLIGIFGVVLVSVLYPAIKASRFQVVEAIRFV